jgi:hypothetical protein
VCDGETLDPTLGYGGRELQGMTHDADSGSMELRRRHNQRGDERGEPWV